MSDSGFFGLSDCHVLLAAIGGAIFLACLLPRLVLLRAASSAAPLMIPGPVAYSIVPGMPSALDPAWSAWPPPRP